MEKTLKVLMIPHLNVIHDRMEFGINRVVAEYFHYLTELGCTMVAPDATSYDIKASHAGAYNNRGDWPNIAHTHGIIWTADHPATRADYEVNRRIVDIVRRARETTVPSHWVAETFQRDMRFTPHVVPHGIRADEWRHTQSNGGFILWNKNRHDAVCKPTAVTELAARFSDLDFVTTFKDGDAPSNVHATGLVPHPDMKAMIQRAAVYLSTTKETFGIGVLEALAAGTPVLGWAVGGNLDLVRHGVSGYLAQPGNYDDLAQGLAYCLKHRQSLGTNAQESALDWTWDKVAAQVLSIYQSALEPEDGTVSIIIPSHNYGDRVEYAIRSALNQTSPRITGIVVVDDGTEDEGKTQQVVEQLGQEDNRVRYVRQPNSGVAAARNNGIQQTRSQYVCCLDADDAIEPTFIERMVAALEGDRGLGIAYSGLRVVTSTGRTGLGKWPTAFSYEGQLGGHNQIPTCCVFRREMWERLGGYRSRYCPTGAGAEDAEFWLRAGSIGYDAVRATPEPLFIYSMGTGHTANPKYREPNWLEWHPWAYDGQHPFASVAKPKAASHQVRAYDEPIISVIIPVGPLHTETVIDAIDSVEAQTFRKWELVLVDDTGIPTDCENCDTNWLDELLTVYPYLRVFRTPGKVGAGYARNRGVEMSRAPLLLFLDADDYLKPLALEEMLIAHSTYGGAIYTDYEAHATGIADPTKLKNPVKYYSDGYAVIAKRAYDYDWQRIQTGIENPPYIWNLVTTLFPKSWHHEIGGFDESMPSWEDYDYWVRLAYLGKPFTRLPMELVVYFYQTGSRREEGHEIGGQLLYYLNQKREGVEMTPCRGCGSRAQPSTQRRPAMPSYTQDAPTALRASDDDFVLVKYTHPNRGQHHVYGQARFEHLIQIKPGSFFRMEPHADGGYRFYYGYHGGGEQFMVHRADLEFVRWFEPVELVRPRRAMSFQEVMGTPEPPPPPPTPPEPKRMTVEEVLGEPVGAPIEPTPLDERDDRRALQDKLDALDSSAYGQLAQMMIDETQGKNRKWAIDMIRAEMDRQHAGLDETAEISYSNTDDLQRIPGISAVVADALKSDGYTTPESLLELGAEGLQRYRGIGEFKANQIIAVVEDWLKG